MSTTSVLHPETGPSTHSGHKIEDFRRCPRLYALRHVLGRVQRLSDVGRDAEAEGGLGARTHELVRLSEGLRPGGTVLEVEGDALIKGTLGHQGLACHYLRQQARNGGLDPGTAAPDPEEGVRALARRKGAHWEVHADLVVATIRTYQREHVIDPDGWTPIGVEVELEGRVALSAGGSSAGGPSVARQLLQAAGLVDTGGVVVDCEATARVATAHPEVNLRVGAPHPGWPHTQRADLVFAQYDPSGALLGVGIADHKCVARPLSGWVVESLLERYELSGQFGGYDWFGSRIPNYRGSWINFVQWPGKDGLVRFARERTTGRAPAASARWEADQATWFAQRDLLTGLGIPADDWPGAWSEYVCRHAYGPCTAAGICARG